MPQGRFHPEPLRHPCHPGFFAEGAAPLHAHSKRLQLRCRLRAVYARQPIAWALHGPVTQPGCQLGVSLIPLPHT